MRHWQCRTAGGAVWLRAQVATGVTHLFCGSGKAQAMCPTHVQLCKHLEQHQAEHKLKPEPAAGTSHNSSGPQLGEAARQGLRMIYTSLCPWRQSYYKLNPRGDSHL